MITVFGLLGSPSSELLTAAADADLVVGGRRHLDALGVDEDRRIVLGALTPAVQKIAELPESATVVVVASGDPGFFGVVRKLRSLGLRPRVVTAPSSIATAFAAVGLPWDDAAVVSVHGRPLAGAVDLARTASKVAVFTSAESGIRQLAAALSDLDRCWVLAERLGEDDERVRVLDTAAALVAEPLEPNVVLILDRAPDAPDADWPGVIAGPATLPSVTDPAVAEVGVTEPREAEPSASWVGREPILGQVTSGRASAARADQIDAILGTTSVRYPDGARDGLPRAWAECDLIVSHLALGATTRLIAPLLVSKKTDPGVVVVDEAGRFAVPLVGGHGGGANELARRIADGLGSTAVVTTATDALGLPALDTLGWHWSGDVAGVTRSVLDGEPVEVVRSQPWPLPPLPENVRVLAPGVEASGEASGVIVVTDVDVEAGPGTVVLHPPSLVVGMGCNRGTSSAALGQLLRESLASTGLALASVAALTSVDAKADEPGLLALAKELGVPPIVFSAETLAAQDVPNPSAAPLAAVGTPSVAEASVLAYGADLIVEKRRTPEATCAIGRIPARGHLAVVGLGPGAEDLLTPRAREALRSASVVIGYRPYVAQVRSLLRPGTRIISSPMGKEEQRTSQAIELARAGNAVALVSSGDPAIYAMASPTLEQGTEGIDIEIIPGVTASLAASALLGAPLGHDHALISLSDLHTDWQTIIRRVRAVAEADLVAVLYNPRSRTRLHHLPDALAAFAEHRPPDTPVAIVRDVSRDGESVVLTTLGEVNPDDANMNSLVIVGSTTTRYTDAGIGQTVMVTPRDYRWLEA